MSWPQVKISEVTDIVSGATPKTGVLDYWGGDIAWATPADLSELAGTYIGDTPRKITEAGLRSCAASILPTNSVLFSSRAPIGHVAINTVPMATNQGFKSFVPDAAVLDAKFLFWWLKAHRDHLDAMGTGATFKEVSKATVSRIKIPLPPLDEQKRIAAILDKADQLRQKRRQAIALLDGLTQSIFLEMFGDPVSNPKGWPVIRLLDASSKITDGTHDTPQRIAEGVPFLTGKNVRPYKIDLSQMEFVDQQTHEEIFRRCNPQTGDVLYVNIGAGVGNAALNRLDFEFSLKNVALIKPNKSIITGEYIELLLNHSRFKSRLLEIGAQGGAQKFLGLAAIKRIEIPCPPLEMQVSLVKRLKSTDGLRSKLKSQDLSSTSLFSSLQHRAFTGQL